VEPETGFDQIANDGIKDGIITAITTSAVAATGQVATPGFVDTHTHNSQNTAAT
jgi:cytosine/adenosine deaminase-related metal-dependent hydrolase